MPDHESGEHGTPHSEAALYVVATPIGNLEDITLRALRVLRTVDVIAAEHVPVALTLLRRYDIETPVIPYHERDSSAVQLVERMLSGESAAIVSDAGTPVISDPGRRLVSLAVEHNIRVVPIPGASAPMALWSASGQALNQVTIAGFPPRKVNERRDALRSLVEHGMAAIIFESPRRVHSTLAILADLIPSGQLIVGRELTKLHEQIWRGSPDEALDEFSDPRGEFTILILPPESTAPGWTDDALADLLADAAAQGASRSQAARHVAQQTGVARRYIYGLWPFDQQR